MTSAMAVMTSPTLKDRRTLAAVGSCAAALSLVGSSFIVICYLLFKELRKFSFKLIFFLALSDMFCSFFSIIGYFFPLIVMLNFFCAFCVIHEMVLILDVTDPSNGFFCYAQNYSTHFFCVASFLWTTTIAFTLHRTVVKHKPDVEDFGSVFHLYVWGTSLVMTVMRSIGSDSGRLGGWCWTGAEHTGEVAQFLTFYAPLWGAILYNGITYYQVNRMLANATRMAVGMTDRSHQFDTGADKKAFNSWGAYPLILIGSWAFATINRIHDFIYPGHKIFWLSFADVWFAGLMGLFNSIAYGFNSSVRRAIAERFEVYAPEKIKRWLPMKRKGQQQVNELVSLIVEGQ